jgi:hypothetical protein
MKILGKPIQKGPLSYSWSPGGGKVLLPTYEGVTASVSAVANEFRQRGIPFQFDSEGATARLQAQQSSVDTGEVEIPTGGWSCQGGEESVELPMHPLWNRLSADARMIIRDCLEGNFKQRPEDKSGNAVDIVYDLSAIDTHEDSAVITATVGGLPNPEWQLYFMVFGKQTHFVRSTFTLSHRQIVSVGFNEDSLDLIGSNINKNYLPATLAIECEAFTDPITSLCRTQVARAESSLQTQIGTVADLEAIQTKHGNIFGWLKGTPSLSDDGRGRAEVSVSYRLQLWPSIIYPLAT